MANNPLVSVVMGVHNGAAHLERTLESVLTQEGVELEFITVDDGSSDATSEILGDGALRDSRVRVFWQEKKGLTEALILGCEEAGGEFIARQDCGDWSLPGRLAGQVELLRENPEAVLCGCGTRFASPEGVVLREVKHSSEELNHTLTSLTLDDFHGPSHHGSVIFRRSAYQVVGGYRPEFYLAQDLDLWHRLIRVGPAVAAKWVGYEAEIAASALSGRHSLIQRRLREIIFELSRSSDAGRQAQLLTAAAQIRPDPLAKPSEWQGNYFLGSCLQQSHPGLSSAYLKKAVRENPFHVKAWIKLLALAWR